MSSSKKRPFSEFNAGDFYLCSECDAVYHGQQELCEHLAKHSNLKRHACKKICLRNKPDSNILDYTKLPQQLIPSNFTNDKSLNGASNVNALSGIEQLTKATKMNDHYYTYHQLKMSLNTILSTRRRPAHSMKTSLDILHDINTLRHTAKKLGLPCANTDLFDRVQSKLIAPNLKQPPMKVNRKIIKTMTKKKKEVSASMGDSIASNGKAEMDQESQSTVNEMESAPQQQTQIENEERKDSDNETHEMVEEEKTVTFEFDSSDFQRYLDANSEIIGRLQSIRKEKSFYGVTQEEIELNKQFAKNTATMVQYSSLPNRLLN